MTQESKSLIVTIVKKGDGDTVIEASMNAGATGGTIMFGRGIGVRERKKILGVPVEPEKEIVFTVVPTEKAKAILDEIVQSVKLTEPGRGVVLSLILDQFAGVAHELLPEPDEDPQGATEEHLESAEDSQDKTEEPQDQ